MRLGSVGRAVARRLFFQLIFLTATGGQLTQLFASTTGMTLSDALRQRGVSVVSVPVAGQVANVATFNSKTPVMVDKLLLDQKHFDVVTFAGTGVLIIRGATIRGVNFANLVVQGIKIVFADCIFDQTSWNSLQALGVKLRNAYQSGAEAGMRGRPRKNNAPYGKLAITFNMNWGRQVMGPRRQAAPGAGGRGGHNQQLGARVQNNVAPGSGAGKKRNSRRGKKLL